MDHRRGTDTSGSPTALAEPAESTLAERIEKGEVAEIKEVRSTDIEPYTGLRYLSKLFRFMAVILVLLLVAEAVTGVYTQGSASVPTLLGEASRLIVLAGVLWGTGDLAHLLIDVGHDVRAARILVARSVQLSKANATVSSRSADAVSLTTPPIPVQTGFADRAPRRP